MRRAIVAAALYLASPVEALAITPSCSINGSGTYYAEERTRCGIATWRYSCGGLWGTEVIQGPTLVAWMPLQCQNY